VCCSVLQYEVYESVARDADFHVMLEKEVNLFVVLQCAEVWCSAVQCGAVQCSACGAVHCGAVCCSVV